MGTDAAEVEEEVAGGPEDFVSSLRRARNNSMSGFRIVSIVCPPRRKTKVGI